MSLIKKRGISPVFFIDLMQIPKPINPQPKETKTPMKKVLILAMALIFTAMACSETETVSIEMEEPESSGFDSLLAAKLGADDYGMRTYVMAFLKSGPNRSQDSTEAAEIQKGHMANISRLAEEGKLILAGPFMDGGDYRGIFLFDVRTLEEAEALVNTDPAVINGRLIMELHPWYGSAALMQVNDIHNRIQKQSF